MINILQIIKHRIESRKCVQRYHTHKEWVFFLSLVCIVSFLVVWSGAVNHQLTELRRKEAIHSRAHKEFNLSIIDSQLLIIEYMKTNNPELHNQAIKKLTELNARIKGDNDL